MFINQIGNKIFLLIIITCSGWFIACQKKDAIETVPVDTPVLADTATLISGRWKVVKDSVGTENNYLHVVNGHQWTIIPGVYFGVPADFYDFKLNGDLIVHENGNDAISTYQLVADNKLFITDIDFEPASILKMNATESIFFWTDTSYNGGRYGRKLELKR